AAGRYASGRRAMSASLQKPTCANQPMPKIDVIAQRRKPLARLGVSQAEPSKKSIGGNSPRRVPEAPPFSCSGGVLVCVGLSGSVTSGTLKGSHLFANVVHAFRKRS